MRNTIDMAREAGAIHIHEKPKEFAIVGNDNIKAFEALVRADAIAGEREQLIEQIDWTALMRKGGLVTWGDASDLGDRVVDAIRAKGNT
jgi:hypothetical protein